MEFKHQKEELSASDWKHMYCILLQGMDEALELLPADSRASFLAGRILRKSVEEAEEYYISVVEGEN